MVAKLASARWGIADVASRIPGRGGKPISGNTVKSYILNGVKTPGGVVKLAAFRIGTRFLVSEESLETFLRAQNPDIVETPAIAA